MPSAPTVTDFAGSADVAGPCLTSPVAMSNWLPWQAQLMTPSLTLVTVQPWCVHTAENALYSPSVGWVMTTLADSMIVPPPTGMSAFLARSLAAPAAPDAAENRRGGVVDRALHVVGAAAARSQSRAGDGHDADGTKGLTPAAAGEGGVGLGCQFSGVRCVCHVSSNPSSCAEFVRSCVSMPTLSVCRL